MTGIEWIVEAHGCSPAALRDLGTMHRLFATIVEELQLNPVEPALWHQFTEPYGITGIYLLSESHLTCHTFPEFGALCLNLFCCRERPRWDFEDQLKCMLQATNVNVRRIERAYENTNAQITKIGVRTSG
jgi:S-adenosylmethionine decarboxylase